MKTLFSLLTLAFFITAVSGCNSVGTDTPMSANAGTKHLATSADPNAADPQIVLNLPGAWSANAQESINVWLGGGQDISGTTAKFQLYRGVNSVTGAPCCSTDPNVNWVLVAEGAQGANLSYLYTPAANGSYGWQVHFVKGNSSYSNGFATGCVTVADQSGGGFGGGGVGSGL